MARSVFILFCAIIISLGILYTAALIEIKKITKGGVQMMEQRDSVIRENDSLRTEIITNGK